MIGQAHMQSPLPTKVSLLQVLGINLLVALLAAVASIHPIGIIQKMVQAVSPFSGDWSNAGLRYRAYLHLGLCLSVLVIGAWSALPGITGIRDQDIVKFARPSLLALVACVIAIAWWYYPTLAACSNCYFRNDLVYFSSTYFFFVGVFCSVYFYGRRAALWMRRSHLNRKKM